MVASYWDNSLREGEYEDFCIEQSYPLEEGGWVHPIQELSYSPNGELIAIGSPNRLTFVSAKSAELVSTSSLSGLFGNSELVRQDIVRIAFNPDCHKLAVVSNVCSNQLQPMGKVRRRGGVCLYAPNWGKRPKILDATSSRAVRYTDATIVGNRLTVAGINLDGGRPFVRNFDL